MSEISSKIKLIFLGEERGVSRAAAEAEGGVRRLSAADKDAAKASQAAADVDKKRSGTLKELSANLGTVGVYAGLFGAATGAAAAAVGAALPALGSLGLMFGVVKLAMKANNAESKAFHAQLDAMKKPIQDLENTAGKAFLPGVTKFLKDSTTLFPTLDGAVERTGKIMGDTASKMGDLFKSEDFQQSLEDMLRASDFVTSAIGDSFVKLTGKLVEFGGNMAPAAEGFGNAIRDIEAGLEGFLSGLEPHANDFKSIFESLGSILRNVLPIVGQLAGALAAQLAPILQSVAGFIDRNKDAISSWVPFIAQAVTALAGFKLALVGVKAASAVGELLSIGAGIFGVGEKAAGADGKVRGFAGGLGLIKGALAVGAVAAFAVELDKANVAAAGGAQNLQGFEQNLHNIVGAAQQLASGDIGGIMRDISAQVAATNETWKAGQAPAQQWSMAVSQAAVTADNKVQNFFRGLVGLPPLPPVRLDVDPTAGQAHVNDFVGGISRTRGTLQVDGNIDPATGKVTQAVTFANGSRGTITVDGNRIPADGKINGTVQFANGSRGTVTIDGNQTPANGKISATVTYANGSRGTIQVDANTAAANSRIAGLVNNWNGRRINLIVTTTGSGGIASAGRLASGGPVVGPGTGTSDTAGLFALSTGEYVATAKQVQAAGGTAAFGRLMKALEHGPAHMAGGGLVSPMRASAQAAMRTPSAPSGGSSGGGAVVQFTGNTSDALATVIMQMIRTNKIQIKAA